MMPVTMSIATSADVDEILNLHYENHLSTLGDNLSEGFLASDFTKEQMGELVQQGRVTIARTEDGELVAYATAASWEYWSQFPFFAYLATQVPGKSLNGAQLTLQNTYEYGPVCVARKARGSGLFEHLFCFSLESMRSRYPYMIAFVNKRNERSYAAHTRKAGMSEIGEFSYEGGQYILLACSTDLCSRRD